MINNKISIISTTRADYGLLCPVIRKLYKYYDMVTEVVVTGMHLSEEFGNTYTQIEKDGIQINYKIPILTAGDTPSDISATMANALTKFAEYFEKSKPNIVVLLGDRYETLAIACAAHNARIPIAHLYGGETTEGAVDEAYRHAITKMSSLHFTSTEAYRKRVIQLGEQPDTVYNVGAVGVENALNVQLLSKDQLQQELGVDLQKQYALGTFHPVTLENNTAEEQVCELLKAISKHTEYNYIFTKSNSDANGEIINEKLDEYAQSHNNLYVFASLGTVKYLSAIKYSEFVIGNSSSGIIEVPSFKIPTVNIGDRQKGRIAAASVINCEPNYLSITQAINKAVSEKFRTEIFNMQNPYEKADTSESIVRKIVEQLFNNSIQLKKKFYDIKFNV